MGLAATKMTGNYGVVALDSLFGKDVQKLTVACEKIMHNWIYRYEGCYLSPTRPRPSRVWGQEGVSFRELTEIWKAENPEEVRKEQESRKKWEENRDKQFRVVYGIAKRHGLYLEWCGNGSVPEGDRFLVYQNHETIAKLQCW